MDPSPYTPGAAYPAQQQPYVVPNPGNAKTIGVLNIVFGAILLLCGICGTIQSSAISAFVPMMSSTMNQEMQKAQTQRDQRIAELKELEESSQDEGEKARLQAEREKFESQPMPKMPDMNKLFGMGDSRVSIYLMVDSISSLVLNLIMLISGIGLVGMHNWARVTAIWIAAIKIVRLLVLNSIFLFVVLPVMVEGTNDWYRELFEQLEKTMPPGQGPPPAQMGQIGTMYGVMWGGMAVAMIVLGVIYPAIVLWSLSRSGVKAAFRAPAGPPA